MNIVPWVMDTYSCNLTYTLTYICRSQGDLEEREIETDRWREWKQCRWAGMEQLEHHRASKHAGNWGAAGRQSPALPACYIVPAIKRPLTCICHLNSYARRHSTVSPNMCECLRAWQGTWKLFTLKNVYWENELKNNKNWRIGFFKIQIKFYTIQYFCLLRYLRSFISAEFFPPVEKLTADRCSGYF